MKLYLVQHAEAKLKEEDPERPLTEKGWNDIRKVACFAAEHTKIRLSYIVHSGNQEDIERFSIGLGISAARFRDHYLAGTNALKVIHSTGCHVHF